MTPEDIKAINSFLVDLPEYKEQLLELEQRLNEMGQILLKEYNSVPHLCPCCGKEPAIINSKAYFMPWRMYCKDDACYWTVHAYGTTKEQAIANWNKLVYDYKRAKKEEKDARGEAQTDL